MKKLVYIALTSLTFFACTQKEVVKVENTVPKVQPVKVGELKIAYYDQDTMKLQFKYYKEQEAVVTKKQLAFQKELEKRSAKMQADYQIYMKRAQNNELSQVEAEAYQSNLQQQEMALQNYQQSEGARLEKETLQKLEVIGNKIQKASEKYCKENGIDILMIQAQGGQFNYINQKMNVTKEFIAYLNQHQQEIEKEIKGGKK